MKKNKLRELIYNHFYKNIRLYFLVICIFLVGIIIGVCFVSNSSIDIQTKLKEYIQNFIEQVTSSNYSINNIQLFQQSIKQNIILGLIMWIMGSTVIGFPIVIGIVGYKGFCLGYTISTLIGCVGGLKGIVLIIFGILLQNILIIPALMIITVSSINLYKRIIKNRMRENIKTEVLKHTIVSIFGTMLLVLSTFIEVYISTNLFLWILNLY